MPKTSRLKGKRMNFDTKGHTNTLFPTRLTFLLRLGRPLAGDKVIRWPRAAHHYFYAGQMPGRHLVTVLVLLHLFVVDQVRDVNQHAAGIDLAAADILVKRIKNFVDLDRKGARLGLALTMAYRFFPQLGQVLAPHRRR